jgi:hypothetical protein
MEDGGRGRKEGKEKPKSNINPKTEPNGLKYLNPVEQPGRKEGREKSQKPETKI